MPNENASALLIQNAFRRHRQKKMLDIVKKNYNHKDIKVQDWCDIIFIASMDDFKNGSVKQGLYEAGVNYCCQYALANNDQDAVRQLVYSLMSVFMREPCSIEFEGTYLHKWHFADFRDLFYKAVDLQQTNELVQMGLSFWKKLKGCVVLPPTPRSLKRANLRKEIKEIMEETKKELSLWGDDEMIDKSQKIAVSAGGGFWFYRDFLLGRTPGYDVESGLLEGLFVTPKCRSADRDHWYSNASYRYLDKKCKIEFSVSRQGLFKVQNSYEAAVNDQSISLMYDITLTLYNK